MQGSPSIAHIDLRGFHCSAIMRLALAFGFTVKGSDSQHPGESMRGVSGRSETVDTEIKVWTILAFKPLALDLGIAAITYANAVGDGGWYVAIQCHTGNHSLREAKPHALREAGQHVLREVW